MERSEGIKQESRECYCRSCASMQPVKKTGINSACAVCGTMTLDVVERAMYAQGGSD